MKNAIRNYKRPRLRVASFSFNLLLAAVLIFAFDYNETVAAEDVSLVHSTLKTIIIDNYSPYTFVNEEGQPAGFSVDLMQAVATVMDINLEIRVDTWDNARRALENGEIDFLPMMAYSEERDKLYDFSPPHTIAFDAFFTRKDASAVLSMDDLHERTIIVMESDQAHDYLLSVGSIKSEQLILVDSLPEALRLLASGTGDTALMPKLVGLALIRDLNLTNLELSPVVVEAYNRPFSFAVRDGNQAVLERLNQGMNIVKTTGQYDEIYNKWFGALEPRGISIEIFLKYLGGIILTFILIGVMLILWSFSLRKQVAARTKSLEMEIQERKHAEEALRKSEEWHRTVLQTAIDGFWMTDMQGRLMEVNDAYCRMSGYSKSELLSMSIADLEVDETVDETAAHIQKVEERGEDRFETRHRRKDGSIFSVGISVQHRPNDGGQLIMYLRDITERKQAEAALRESEEKYRFMTENSSDILWHLNREYRFDYISPADERLRGFKQEEVIGTSIWNLFKPEGVEQVRQIHANHLNNNRNSSHVGTMRYELEQICKDGSWVWTEINATVHHDQYGNLVGLHGVTRDITERKRAEGEIRRMVERWATIYRAGEEIGASLDTEQVFQAVYRAVRQVMPCEDFLISLYDEKNHLMWGDYIIENGIRVSSNPYQIFENHNNVAPDLPQTVRGLGGYIVHFGKSVLLNNPEEIKASGIKFISYGSEPTTSSVLAVPLQLRGKTIGMLSAQSYHLAAYTSQDQELLEMLASHAAIAIDNARLFEQAQKEIAERMQAEEETHQLNDELEKRVEERTRELRDAQEQLVRHEKLAVLGQMASSIGHELRNPLSVITSAVYYLKMVQPNADDKIKQYLGIIDQEVHTSEKIISDLLDFARIKSVDREVVSVSDLIHQTLERFPVPPEVEVTVEILEDLPRAFVDPRQMTQVLGNLTLNACQSMLPPASTAAPKSAQLSLYSSVQDDMIKIIVKDNGVGIPPENMKKIFEPLFTTKAKGVGLGLPVSQKLVEANGGRIEVTSEAGKGSSFSVFLPIYKESK